MELCFRPLCRCDDKYCSYNIHANKKINIKHNTDILLKMSISHSKYIDSCDYIIIIIIIIVVVVVVVVVVLVLVLVLVVCYHHYISYLQIYTRNKTYF